MTRDPIVARVFRSGTDLVLDWKQPGRRRILERNAADQGAGYRKSDFIRPLARIPILDREVLMKRHPDAFRGDRRAMEKFLASSEGRPYRTTARGRSRPWSFGGLPK